jgi:hypothetical protein
MTVSNPGYMTAVVMYCMARMAATGLSQLKFQVTWMRPNDWSASCENAAGLRSRSVSSQPGHKSVAWTVTLFP